MQGVGVNAGGGGRVKRGGGHLDCKAAFAAADRLLVRLPLVRPARLRHVDVFLPAEALP